MQRSSLVTLLACTFALLAGKIGAQNAPDSAVSAPLSLKVTVVDAATKAPVPGAKISSANLRDLSVVTDATGVAQFTVPPFPLPPEKDTQFSFQVVSPDYEQRRVEWFSDGGRVRDTVPAAYEVALRPGVIAGGVVRDARGAPIAGAKIMLFASALRSRPMGRGDKMQQEYPSLSIAEADALVTDAQGAWRFDHFPSEVTQIYVDVIRPGGSRRRFMAGAMFRGPGDRSGTVEVPDLLAQKAVFTLNDGATIRGQVVDTAGKPVGNVQLRVRDAASRNQPDVFTTNPDGSFQLSHWDAASVLVTAEKEGFQTASLIIAAEGDTGFGKIVLAPAKPLRVRLVDETGAPVRDFDVRSDPNPVPDQIVVWSGKTDAEGRVAWPTAPDKPVTLWFTPPKDSDLPGRSARLTASDTEHVLSLRRGTDKAIRIVLRVVDAETGAPVPKFEVWRKLVNQPFRPWGEPSTSGEFKNEIAIGEMPNGWVPQYGLQVRAAGYTGWSNERIDFYHGDQEHLIKMTKGESALANEPLPRSAGAGLDGDRNPALNTLAGHVARLLESGDATAFARAVNASLDDWKRILPAGVDEKELPLGPTPARIIEQREKQIAASATQAVELARTQGVLPGKMRFTVKSVSAPTNLTTGFRIAGQQVTMSSAFALRVLLAGEPVGDAGGKPLRGDYELSIGTSRQFPSGWRTDEGVRWVAFPPGLADEPTRRELALANRAAATSPGDQRVLSAMDDPALLQLGEALAVLVQRRDVPAFVRAATFGREELVALSERTGAGFAANADELLDRVSSGLTAAVRAMVTLQDRIGIDLSDAKIGVKQVLAERPRFTRFGMVDGLRAANLRVVLTVDSPRQAKSGQPLSGSYTLAMGDAVRANDKWVLMDDKIRFQEFPRGIVPDDDLKHVELENYVAENRALPPGHMAPDVPFTRFGEETETKLSAYRGKVVILEFWAVWCGPCQEPMEKLQYLRDANLDWKDRVEVLTISIDDKAAEARAHLEKKGWLKTNNAWAGPAAWSSPSATAFRVRGIPTAYVIGRDGRIIKGGHPASLDFARIVNEELKKPAP